MSLTETPPDRVGTLLEELSNTDTPWIEPVAEGEVHPPVDEDELLGDAIDDVPKLLPGIECNARRTDDGVFVGYCANRAGKGTDHVGEGRCSFHGGAADNVGEANGNYAHGAYSRAFHEALLSYIEEQHPGTLEAAEDDPEARDRLGQYLAAFAMVKFRRSGDPRHALEWESICEAFGLYPDGGDQ